MHQRVIQSGDLIEIYTYEKAPYPPSKRAKRRKSRSTYKKTHRSTQSIMRAVLGFNRLVRTTLALGAPHFLTLTFAGEPPTLQSGYKKFTAFAQRLRKKYGPEVAWVAVPEFGTTGTMRLHFHVLVWGLPYETHIRERGTRQLAQVWKQGFLDIIETDGHPKLASYFAKYMSKTMSSPLLAGQKAYTASRNCLRPVRWPTSAPLEAYKEAWGTTVDNLIDPHKEREYSTQWLGRASYKAYSLSNQPIHATSNNEESRDKV